MCMWWKTYIYSTHDLTIGTTILNSYNSSFSHTNFTDSLLFQSSGGSASIHEPKGGRKSERREGGEEEGGRGGGMEGGEEGGRGEGEGRGEGREGRREGGRRREEGGGR